MSCMYGYSSTCSSTVAACVVTGVKLLRSLGFMFAQLHLFRKLFLWPVSLKLLTRLISEHARDCVLCPVHCFVMLTGGSQIMKI